MLNVNEKGKTSLYKQFYLPMPPEALQITTPFAINNTVTLNGIIEQHNAFPLIQINLTGTTGFLQALNTPKNVSANIGKVSGIFGGVIGAIQTVASSFDTKPTTSNLINKDINKEMLTTSISMGDYTGYSQFMQLRNFLESYSILKKSDSTLRLGFEIAKDNVLYICTPKAFSLKRDANSPYEYKYDLQLEAWQRRSSTYNVSSVGGLSTSGITGPSNFQNGLSKFINALSKVSTFINNLGNLASAIRNSVKAILNVITDVISAAKSMANFILSLPDLASNIFHDIVDAIGSIWPSLVSIYKSVISGSTISKRAKDDWNWLFDGVGLQKTGNSSQSTTMPLPGTAAYKQLMDRVDEIFKNPDKHYDFLSSITLDKLNLPPNIQARVDRDLQRVRNFTSADYKRMQDDLKRRANVLARQLGCTTPTFDLLYGLDGLPQLKNNPNENDYELVNGVNQIASELDLMILNSASLPSSSTPNIDYIAGLANASNISFTIPRSKFPVPFSYGMSLERLSAQYLGDPNRWGEIAAVNGLRAPYVDEVGLQYPLLTNGNKNVIILEDASVFVPGQTISLQSNTVRKEYRKIISLTKYNTQSWGVELDGASDLSRFTTTDVALFDAFLPYTINSQSMIFIPSPKDAQGVSSTSPQDKRTLENIFDMVGSDLLLDENTDLVIATDGDARYSTGITNIVQYLRVILSTNTGGILQHPEIGGMPVGASLADINANTVLKSVNAAISNIQFIQSWTHTTKVTLKGPQADVSIDFTIPNTSMTLPVSFQINLI
jgi:hypothetical protein